MNLNEIENRMLELVVGFCRNAEGEYPHDPAECDLCLTGPLLEAAIKDEFDKLRSEEK